MPNGDAERPSKGSWQVTSLTPPDMERPAGFTSPKRTHRIFTTRSALEGNLASTLRPAPCPVLPCPGRAQTIIGKIVRVVSVPVTGITPPTSPHHRPPFWEIDEYSFQDLTVELLNREPELKNARLHGTRGQKQFGVDGTAEMITGGRLAASCKRYKSATVDLIKEACEEFDEHRRYWKTQDCRRFVVVVAGYADDPKVQKDEVKRKKLYLKRAIEFELWDGTIITQKVRPHPDLVHRFLSSDNWLTRLCGPQYASPRYAFSGVGDVEANRLRELLAASTQQQIDSLLAALRRGHRSEVRNKLAVLQRDRALWPELKPEIRGAALRLQAALALDAGNADEAGSLVTEALALDPGGSVVALQTRIRAKTLGPEAALAALPSAADEAEVLCARGLLLLVLGRIDEAAPVLETAHRRKPDDPDAIRLLAILAAMRNDISLALQFVERATALAGDWEVVRWTRAIIFYLSALSSARLQNPISAIPDPIDWALVRRDDASASRLAAAAEIFCKMAEDLDRPSADREALEIWWLSCLANLAGEQAGTAQICAKLIEKTPCNIYAVPWAIVRDYPVDFDRAVAIATHRTDVTPSDVGPIVILVACKSRTGDHAAIKEILTKYRSRFESAGQMDIWQHWWMVQLVMSGDAAGALAFAETASRAEVLQAVEAIARIQQTRQGSDSSDVANYLLELFRNRGDSRFLMLWAGLQASCGNWPAIRDRANELLRAVPTPDALYLVLTADFEVRDYRQCLLRLDKSRDIFPGSRFPIEVGRLRIACLERSGRPRDALREAGELIREDAGTATLASFAKLCVVYGDVQKAVAAGFELAGREDISADDALTIAELLLPHSLPLSRQLLRRANARNIPDTAIIRALTLGQRLALDQEQAELRKRLQTLAGQPDSPVRALAEKDVQPLLSRVLQTCNEILSQYEAGLKPVHEAIDRCGFDVMPLLSANSGQSFRPFEQLRFFVLHGNRASTSPSIPPSVSRLNLDITSVLLIQRLNLWGPIEEAIAEIRCSHLVIPILNRILVSLATTQPDVEAALGEALELCREGRIRIDEPGGGARDKAEPTPIDVRTADDLRLRGLITENEHAKAARSLPAATTDTDRVLPELGSRAQCTSQGILLLAQSGLLRAFASTFEVYVSAEDFNSIKSDVSAINNARCITDSIKHLIDSLGERFQAGKLLTFPETAAAASNTLAIHALAELATFTAVAGDMICADDRFTNGFDHRDDDNRTPIVSTVDLLNFLAERGIVDRVKVWQARHDLRSANCVFIPFDPEEILYNLTSAATRDGDVLETPELRVMRQYMAGCFALGQILQRGVSPGGRSELEFALSLRKAVVEALALLWADKNQRGRARLARANWLIDSLYVDHLGICCATAINKSPAEERQLTCMSAGTLMMLNLDSSVDGPDKDALDRYSEWIWNSLFKRRCNANPNLLREIANCISSNFAHIADGMDMGDHKDRGLLIAAMLRITARFPPPLRGPVQDNIEALPGFGDTMRPVLKIEEGLEFDAHAYIRQVASALATGSATTQALRTKEEVVIHRVVSSDSDAIDLFRPLHKRVHRLRNALWAVLLDAPEQEPALRRHSRLFDVTPEEFETLLHSLASETDPVARFETAAAAARDSLAFFYHGLEERIQFNEPLLESDFIPDSAAAFFRYYGGEQGTSPDAATLIVQAPGRLEVRLDVAEIIVRLAALPIPLPSTVEVAFRNAALDRQKAFLHAVLRAGPSPLHRIHALRLACLAQPAPELERLQHWLLRQHFSDTGQQERAAFLSMLEYVKNATDGWHAARPWDRSLRLMFSWSHASQLFAMYQRARAPLTWISEAFHRPGAYEAITDIEEDFVRGIDVASPDIVTPHRIAVCGLAYALSPDSLPLPDALARDAKRQWFTDSGWPRTWLLEMPGSMPNVLASFLGRDLIEDACSLIGVELAGTYGAAWRSRMHGDALESVGSRTEDPIGWIFLAALYRNGPTPGEVAAQVENALKGLDLCIAAQSDRYGEGGFLIALANRLPHVSGAATRTALISSLVKLGKWYGENDGTDLEAQRLVTLVLGLAYPVSGRSSTVAEFEQLCVALARSFPKFAGPCRYTINRFCHDLPIERAADFWRLNFALRALDSGG